MKDLGTGSPPDARCLRNIKVAQLRVRAQRAAGQLQINETPGSGQMASVSRNWGCGGEDAAWSLRERKLLWLWQVQGERSRTGGQRGEEGDHRQEDGGRGGTHDLKAKYGNRLLS